MLTQTTIQAASARPATARIPAVPSMVSHPLGGSIELMGAAMPFARNV